MEKIRMSTPVVSVRASPAAAKVVRLVVKALRQRPGLAHEIRTLIEHAGIEPKRRARGTRQNIGPFRSEAEALATVVGRLVAKLRPEAIYLFGSRALGTANPDSDYDLAVVLRDDWNTDPLDYDAVYEPLLGLGVGCDVVPYPVSIFQAERDIDGTIAFEAAHRGRLLYRAPQ
jgi:predicted nucleotidyltransferase